jgi:ApbE superfamily uncharacterized protein (UPF0280 family)
MVACLPPVPALIEVVPDFEYRGGLFVVTCPLTGVCRAYRPSTYFATLARMAEVGRSYKFGGAEIVPLFPDHAASASGSPSK